MTKRHFVLVTSVDTDGAEAVQPVLERLFGKGCVTQVREYEYIETENVCQA